MKNFSSLREEKCVLRLRPPCTMGEKETVKVSWTSAAEMRPYILCVHIHSPAAVCVRGVSRSGARGCERATGLCARAGVCVCVCVRFDFLLLAAICSLCARTLCRCGVHFSARFDYVFPILFFHFPVLGFAFSLPVVATAPATAFVYIFYSDSLVVVQKRRSGAECVCERSDGERVSARSGDGIGKC